ncbi:MAG: hypothetical protein D6791_00405 [Chloroflexi bacterium]|nr:MAG: hypothetical protein D6791_00405 [Chloroflexota bacterium]
MKRRLTIALTLSLLLALGIYGAVLAQGGSPIDLNSLPGGGWWVSWQVQNVGTQTANLQVQALGADGTTFGSGTASATIDPGAGLTFIPGNLNPLSPELEPGFIGSAVLSADQPIVAIGFVQNNQVFDLGVPGGLAGAAYQGVSGDDAGSTVAFPLVKLDWAGQSTTLYIQAAGAPASVSVTYRMNDGTEVTDGPYDLDADEMKVFTPSDKLGSPACGSDAASTPCLGGAVATSTTGDIVGIFTEHPTVADPAPFVLSTKGFGPNDAGTTLAAPIIKNDWVGRTTGLTVQNASTSQVTVNVTFTGAPPAACAGNTYAGTEVTLDPGKSYVYFPTLGNMGGFPSNCFGSATITGTGPIVATVNESGANKKTVYSAFATANATKKVAVPLVKEDWVNRTTGVALQNVGESSTNVTCTYNVVQSQGTNPGSVTLTSQTIPAGGAIALYRVWTNPGQYGADAAKLEKSFSAVICESDSENIVAIAQEADLSGQFDIKNYEGFNIQ